MIAPTIIIGLGGIGSDICCRVSKLVRDESQRKRLRFVCIDTDINDLRQRRAEDPRIITIQTSAPYTVGNYLKYNTVAKNEWFPVHAILNGKTPTEGAGQVRAISRLAFDTAVREGKMAELEKAIEELFHLDGASDPQAIRVMIVSTLAGGTGSGIVLPTALYVRHFLNNRFQKNASIIRGFFLLPEIMFANKSAEERGSLCCNAYASMRELDAFTRRGDGALVNVKYKDLRLQMPDSTTHSYEDYNVSPFNFCFLYDKRNTDDLQLVSLMDYKEHAANTIYTQTMSGISNRSNSNEDNTIKALVSSNGRNRFCGAGSSLLKYPRDEILNYIADNWALESMGEEWLTIDKAFAQEYKNYKIRKKKNPSEVEPKLPDFYINAVENPEKGSFAEQLRDMCFISAEDETQIIRLSKVDQYTAQLNHYIQSQITKDPEVTNLKTQVQSQLLRIEESMKPNSEILNKDDRIKDDEYEEEFLSLETACLTYARECARVAARVGRIVAMSVFENQKDYTEAKDAKHHMEFFMKDGDGKFIHPNAARYFIYSLQKSLNTSLTALNGSDGNSGQIETLARQALLPFDDLKTTDRVETILNKMESLKKRMRKHLNKVGRQSIMAQIRSQLQAIDGTEAKIGYPTAIAQKTVYEAGKEFLTKIADAFEKFYQNVDFFMEGTKNEAAEIEKRFVNGEGKATRYVCASETCLKQMLEEMPCQTEEVNGPLSAEIYKNMREYALLAKQPNASTYFESFYQDTIMGYWRSFVEDVYATQINMDVLTALEAEADYEMQESLTDDQKRRYVSRVLEEAEKLAAPFIEEPMGDPRHPFKICAYNKAVAGEPNSTRRTFVNKYVDEALSGQIDPNVSPYEMMVYRAIYDLSAGDLKRFRAPTAKEEGGIYYRNYIEVYNKLGPDTATNLVLTPHLDKHWHLTKYMPDLSDENQSVLENRVYTALAWGMLTGKIQQKEYTNCIDGMRGIRYVPNTRGAETFVVPNGSPCDELYEVVDALEINPPQVLLLLKDMEDTMEREKTSRLDLRETKLINSLNWDDKDRALGHMDEVKENLITSITPFRIRQYACGQTASIFDLIYWMKYSTPTPEYDVSVSERALDSLVSLLEDFVAQYEEDETVWRERCFEMLKDQFITFMKNLSDQSITRPSAKRRLGDAIVSRIAVALDDRVRKSYGLETRFDGTMSSLLEVARVKLNGSSVDVLCKPDAPEGKLVAADARPDTAPETKPVAADARPKTAPEA